MKKVILNFSGCGGLYHYYVGLCAYIQDNYDINDIEFTSVSGGNLPIFCLVNNIPCLTTYDLLVKRLNSYNNNSLYNQVKFIYHLAFEHLLDVYNISKNNVNSINYDLNYHNIIINNFDTNLTETINNYKSIEDYLHIVIGSAYIPIPGYKKYWEVKTRNNQKYYDGSLSQYWYFFLLFYIILYPIILLFNYLIPMKPSKNNEIIINPLSLDGCKSYGNIFSMLGLTCVGITTEHKWMCFKGYIDGINILGPQLKKFKLNKPTNIQVKSTDMNHKFNNQKTNFDIKNMKFF